MGNKQTADPHAEKPGVPVASVDGTTQDGLGVERQAAFWLLAAICFVFAIGLLKEILLPFVTGLLVAYCFNPLTDLLERSLVPRWASAALIVVLLTVGFILSLVYLVPMLITQAQELAFALPGRMEQLKGVLEGLVRERLGDAAPRVEAAIQEAFAALNNNWDSMASWVAQSLWTQGKALFNFVSLMLVTPLVVFYLLVDWKPMLAQVDTWLPRQHAGPLRTLATDINAAVGAFVRGQGLVCLILAIFYAIALTLLGLEHGLLIGLATGVASFVPFVGWALGTIVATTLAVVQFWPDVMPVLMVFGVFMAGQILDTSFLSPQIVGSRVGLHPVWVLFALIAFSYLFGVVGVLLAIPLAAAVGVIVRFALAAYLKSAVYTGDNAGPEAVSDAAGVSRES